MVVLGLIFIVLGIIALLAGIFLNDGTATIIGIDVSSVTIFIIGAIAGAAILWGYSILKWGTKRGLAHRKERRELNRMADKLDRVEAERRAEQGAPPPAQAPTQAPTQAPSQAPTQPPVDRRDTPPPA